MSHCSRSILSPNIAILLLAVGVAGSVQSVQASDQISFANPDNINELFAYLDSNCVPRVAGSEGSEFTLRFSLANDGTLRGPPMVTYSNLKGSEETQRLLVTGTIDALEKKCTPIPMTEQFGKIAATKMILWKVHTPTPFGNRPRPSSI